MADDLEITESGESSGPKYDTSTDTVTEKGEKREPTTLETVKAAYLEHKAEKDPVERFRQRAEKNLGPGGFHETLRRVEEFDNQPDLGERLRWVARTHGVSDDQMRDEIVKVYTPQDPEITSAIAKFDQKYNDPLSKSLRPAAARILSDPRNSSYFPDHMSTDQKLETAFALAFHAAQEQPERAKATAQQQRKTATQKAAEKVTAMLADKAIH